MTPVFRSWKGEVAQQLRPVTPNAPYVGRVDMAQDKPAEAQAIQG